MNFRAGVLYAEGAPSYGVDLSSVTPRRWADSFEEIGAETDYIQPREFERLAEILDYDVIANPYGGVLPEHGAHLVTAGLRTFTEEGGLFLEVMPPPFYLCYFSEDGTLVSMIDVIGGQYGQILTKSSGFDRRLKLTPAGRKILDAAAVPRSVFMANKGSVLSTLYNYSSKPGLPLIITDRGEPVLDILNVGKGRIVRWGCNLEKPHLDFLFKAYRRIINYLLKEPSYRRPSRRPRKVVAVSISPFNYLVGDPARQEVSVTVVDRWGLGLNGLTLRLRSVTKPHLVIEMLQQSPQAREVHFTFRTGLTFRETGKIRMEAFSRGKRLVTRVFKPVFAARSTVFSESRLKDARPETRRPEDFDDFWDTTLDEVARGRGDFKEVLDNSRSDSRMQLYRFSFKSLGGRRVRGWLCVPASGAVGPAILLLPGYSDGSKFIPLQLIERGCAVMALDPRGHGESVREGSRRFPGFISENVLDRLRYPYRGVYMDCLVAVRHLLSHPRVDGGRVGVMGMSQGGGLALITASFERNVAFAIADSPFLADMVRGIRLATDGPYVELAEYLDKRPSTREKVLENLSYFDAVNFAERVACPTLMCVGLMDTICPPITAYATYNTLRCIKRIDTYPRMGHFCGVYGHQDRKIEWIKKCLRLCDG